MESEYLFDEESYANLAALGIGWPDVIAVLRRRPRLIRWRGGLLQIASKTPTDQWMVVNLDAREGEVFVVRHARYMDDDEITNVYKVLAMWSDAREQQ